MRKKRLLLCIWALMIPLGVFGQTPISKTYHVTLHDSIEHTLVREYVASNASDPNWTISYIETQAGHYFALDRNTGTLLVIEIGSNITVNDFLVEDDTVLFCGKNAQNRGIVGHFTVNQFFAGGFPYRVSDTPMTSTAGQVRELNKMVTYVSGGIRKVVALGKTMSGIYCVVDMQCPLGSSMGNYQVGVLPTSFFESTCDITVTDNHVVTAGFYWLTDNLLVVRAYDKNNIFANGGLQDSAIIITPTGTNLGEFTGNQLALSHVGSDYFALATFWNHSGNIYEGLAMLGFHFPFSNQSAKPHKGAMMTQFYSDSDWSILGMTKQSTYTSPFYVLTESGSSGLFANHSEVTEIYYNNLITGNDISEAEYTTNYRLMSIDNYISNTRYVANGYSRTDKTKLVFEIGMFHDIDPYNFNSSLTCLTYRLDKSMEFKPEPHSTYRPYTVTLPQLVSFITMQGVRANVYPIVGDCEKY